MIKIARIREGSGDIKAFVDIETPQALIKGFRVVESDSGCFLGLPSRKGADGKHHAQYIPCDALKAEIEKIVMEAVLNFQPTDKIELSDLAIQVHTRLHRGDDVILGKKTMKFKDGKVRALDVLGYRFITQNPEKNTKDGIRAQKGTTITWVLRNQEWLGKVVDGVYKTL